MLKIPSISNIALCLLLSAECFPYQNDTPRSALSPMAQAKKMEASYSTRENFLTEERIRIAKRSSLSPEENQELKSILGRLKLIRETYLQDALLVPRPNFSMENICQTLEKTLGLLTRSDLIEWNDKLDIKYNADLLDGRGYAFTIFYQGIPLFSYTYLQDYPLESLLPEGGPPIGSAFKNSKQLRIVKCIWEENPVRVWVDEKEKKLAEIRHEVLPVGRGLRLSRDVWLNPWGPLDAHFLLMKDLTPTRECLGPDYVIQPLSPDVHAVGKKPELLQLAKNLRVDANAPFSLVIGDLHTDTEGLLNLLSFMRERILVPKPGGAIDWNDPDSYEINAEALNQKFPQGLNIVLLGDLFGRKKDILTWDIPEDESLPARFGILSLVLDLQEKLRNASLQAHSEDKFKLSYVIGNYEVASTLYSSLFKSFIRGTIPPEGIRKAAQMKQRVLMTLKGLQDPTPVFDHVARLFWDSARAYSENPASSPMQAAHVVEHRLAVHGGMSDRATLHILNKIWAERNPAASRPLNPDKDYIPKSKRLLEKSGLPIDSNKIYQEDLADWINQAFFRLFEVINPQAFFEDLLRKVAEANGIHIPDGDDPNDYFNTQTRKILAEKGLIQKDVLNLDDVAEFINRHWIQFGSKVTTEDVQIAYNLRFSNMMRMVLSKILDLDDLFFGNEGIIEGTPDALGSSFLCPHVSGHAPEYNLAAAFPVLDAGKRVVTDVELYAQPSWSSALALFPNETMCQVSTGRNDSQVDVPVFFGNKDTRKISIHPPAISAPEHLAGNSDEGKVENIFERPLQFIKSELGPDPLGEITAVLLSLGIGIESLIEKDGRYSCKAQMIRFGFTDTAGIPLPDEKVGEYVLNEIQKRLRDLARNRKGGVPLSAQYFQLMNREYLNIGISHYSFPRVSVVDTELAHISIESIPGWDSSGLQPALPKHALVVKIRTAERTGLLHLLSRVLAEEEGFDIHYLNINTVKEGDKLIAEDYFVLSSKDGESIDLGGPFWRNFEKKMKTLFNSDVINGRVLGKPGVGFRLHQNVKASRKEAAFIRRLSTRGRSA